MAKPSVPELILLHLVYLGVDTVEKLSAKLGRPFGEVKSVADKLEITGYLEEVGSGIIWKRKKLKLTDQGLRELLKFKKRLRDDIKDAAEKLAEGRRVEAREAISSYAPYIKDLVALGLIGEDCAEKIEDILG